MTMSRLIIDAHVHVYPEAAAVRAIAAVTALGTMRAHADGSLAGQLAAMRRAGIDRALNLPVATDPDKVEAINDWAIDQCRPPLFSLAAIHPDSPEPLAILRAAQARGLRGVKLHPEYQAFDPGEERLADIWQACEALDFPIVFHSGYDAAFPPPFRSSPAKFAALAQAHPRLRMVLAHCGCLQDWAQVPALLADLPQVAVDLAYSFGVVPPEGLAGLVRSLGAERVIFGTDSPWRDPVADLAAFRALPLSPGEQERILWRNAAELFALEA